jgi:hypothetical protein
MASVCHADIAATSAATAAIGLHQAEESGQAPHKAQPLHAWMLHTHQHTLLQQLQLSMRSLVAAAAAAGMWPQLQLCGSCQELQHGIYSARQQRRLLGPDRGIHTHHCCMWQQLLLQHSQQLLA